MWARCQLAEFRKHRERSTRWRASSWATNPTCPTRARLLIATGGVPRTLDIPGADLPGVFFLRRLDDALALREHLTSGTPVVVIGAGFIGAEVAASARALGCEVTMLEIAEIPLGRALGPEIGQIYADVHREHGVELRTRCRTHRRPGVRVLSARAGVAVRFGADATTATIWPPGHGSPFFGRGDARSSTPATAATDQRAAHAIP